MTCCVILSEEAIWVLCGLKGMEMIMKVDLGENDNDARLMLKGRKSATKISATALYCHQEMGIVDTSWVRFKLLCLLCIFIPSFECCSTNWCLDTNCRVQVASLCASGSCSFLYSADLGCGLWHQHDLSYIHSWYTLNVLFFFLTIHR